MHAQRIYMFIWIPSAASATYFPMAFYCYCSLQVQPASSAFLFSRRADRLPREGMQFTLLFIQLVPRCAWHWISEFQLSAEKGKSSRAQKLLWDISVPCVELPCGCSVSALPAASGHSADGTGTSLGSSTPGWRGGTGWGRDVWAPLQSDLPAQPSVSL